MRISEEKWKESIIAELEIEAKRVLKRIEDAKSQTNWFVSPAMAALKRSTLDFNNVGVKLRKGYWQNHREEVANAS